MRRRGTAIIETAQGIIVAAGRHRVFLLPGGTANRGESRRRAVIREVKEETNLDVYDSKYLFTWVEPQTQAHRAEHKVFLVKAYGIPEPNYHDVHSINFWKPGLNIELSGQTKEIIEIYLKEYKDSNKD